MMGKDSHMQTSEAGIAFIAKNEGDCLNEKSDNTGPQIGHGHDLTGPEQATLLVYGIDISAGITPAQADYILQRDLATIYDPALNRLQAQGLIPAGVSQNQWDSLADFVYNDGSANCATMLHHGWALVPQEMMLWVWGKVNGVEVKIAGLVARRQAEVSLFNS
jgi:GH24 family phage-related lysozyme (muramidase)